MDIQAKSRINPLTLGFILILLIPIVFLGLKILTPKEIACTTEAKLCPDGSTVGRVPPSCEFAQCPITLLSLTPTPTQFLDRSETIDSSGRKTYRDGENLYLIQYPSNFEFIPQGDKAITILKIVQKPSGIPSSFIYVSVIPDDFIGGSGVIYNYDPEETKTLLTMQVGEKKPIRVAEDKYSMYWTYERLSNIAIDGIEAKVYKNDHPWAPIGITEKRLYVHKNSRTYLIGAYLGEDGIDEKFFNQILSTFQFLDQISTPSLKEIIWIPYSNESFGISFQYPNIRNLEVFEFNVNNDSTPLKTDEEIWVAFRQSDVILLRIRKYASDLSAQEWWNREGQDKYTKLAKSYYDASPQQSTPFKPPSFTLEISTLDLQKAVIARGYLNVAQSGDVIITIISYRESIYVFEQTNQLPNNESLEISNKILSTVKFLD